MKTNENSGIETIVTNDSNGSSLYLNCVFTENIDFVKRFSITAINTIECLSINILHKNLFLPNGPEMEILQHIFREKDTAPDALKNVILLFIQDFENENSSEKDVKGFIEKKLTSLWKTERKDVKSSYSKFFDFQVYFLPNKKYETAKFVKTCEIILSRIEEELSRFDYTDDGSETVDETIKKFLIKWKQSETESEKNTPNGKNDISIASKLEKISSDVLEITLSKIGELAQQVDRNEKIIDYGMVAQNIIEIAKTELHDKLKNYVNNDIILLKCKNLECVLTNALHVIFVKQLSILTNLSVSHYKTTIVSEEVPSDFAFLTADSFFFREATNLILPNSSWEFRRERTYLHGILQEISSRIKELTAEKIKDAEQQSNAFQYLQMQQAQIQSIQQQYGGGVGNWNIGAAYRPPDSNVNISVGYQQGKTNIQISMVPDEQAGLLGANGFTAGVGPGNLGISLNLNF